MEEVQDHTGTVLHLKVFLRGREVFQGYRRSQVWKIESWRGHFKRSKEKRWRQNEKVIMSDGIKLAP